MKNSYSKRYSNLSKSSKERTELEGYPTEFDSFVLSYLTLRRLIGFLGISLPVICLISSLFYESPILPSISHYYHSTCKIVFSSVLLLLTIFLWTYHGADKYERGICRALAIMALLIVIFPTTNDLCILKECYTTDDLKSFVFPAIVGQPWIGVIHLISAAIFFVLLIALIFFKFIPHEQKKDNPDQIAIRIYKFCGWGMVLSMLGIVATMPFSQSFKDWRLPPTFSFETLSLICFGVSWLTKGESFKSE